LFVPISSAAIFFQIVAESPVLNFTTDNDKIASSPRKVLQAVAIQAMLATLAFFKNNLDLITMSKEQEGGKIRFFALFTIIDEH